MTTAPTAGSGSSQRLSAEWVEAARVRLLEQRAFRVEQLADLSRRDSDGVVGPAAEEINAALRVAATAALADLDAALRRIERGTFGRCRRCGETLSMARLDAVASASLCGACHRASDRARATRPPRRGRRARMR